jgi:glycyl-tRNA synthetase beta chain
MAELLLELFSEEIPASLQIKASKDFEEGLAASLQEANLHFDSVKSYSTPRRITVVITGLQKTQKSSVEERRGPRVDAPEQAISGFLKSAGLQLEDLEKRATDKGEFYFAVIKKKGKSASETLIDILQAFISSYTWPKSMYWGNSKISWIRPLHNILCIFDGEVLPLKYGHLSANNKTFGHRFLSEGEIVIENFKDYCDKLKINFVILDIEERKKIITEQADSMAESLGLHIKNDEKLLSEAAGLVEWPVPLLGRIEDKFMAVPQDVLITAMRSHQKYFSLLDSHKRIAPYFITVSNIISEDKGKQIVKGNERVLRARLEDAKFFWDTDRRTSLDSRVKSLELVVFHAKLGTVADKTTRVAELAKFLSIWIPHANLVLVEKAALLSKADLTTLMVGEFPELQGLMGSYYALESKEDKAVALAIKEHYSPVGPSDMCPSEPLSVAVALADKVDTLVGLFAVNEKPTGSKDPYALRRAALGVIRIIIENNLNIPLKLLIEKSLSKYPKTILNLPSKVKKRKLLAVGVKKKLSNKHHEKIVRELLEFFADRLRASLKDQNIRHDLIESVFDDGKEDDLTRIVLRVTALQKFLQEEDGKNLLYAYKRATNIVLAEEKKDQVSYFSEPDVGLLQADEEKLMYKLFNEIKPSIEKSLKKGDFAIVMQELAKLRKPVDDFFENVTVNCDNILLRKNRLNLLSQLREFLNKVANFSKIES